MKHDFRMTLRRATRAEHDDLDEMLSQLDLSEPEDLRTFLSLHLTCFTLMLAQAEDPSQSKSDLLELVSGLRSDLAALGPAAKTAHPHAIDGPIDPLAMRYMIEGSRLGTRVLERRWRASSDPVALSAHRYLTTDFGSRRWSEVCKALSDIPEDSARAQSIIQDTKRLFILFQSAFKALDVTRPNKEFSNS